MEKEPGLARRAGQLLAAAGREVVGTSGIDTVVPTVAAVADRYDEPASTADADHVEVLGVAVESY